MLQSSILDVINHALGLCCTSAVKTADCAAPMQFIHAVSDSCAGYFLTTTAYKASKQLWVLMYMVVSNSFLVLLLFPKSSQVSNAYMFQILVSQSFVILFFLEPIHKTIRYSCYVQVYFCSVKNNIIVWHHVSKVRFLSTSNTEGNVDQWTKDVGEIPHQGATLKNKEKKCTCTWLKKNIPVVCTIRTMICSFPQSTLIL